MRAARRIQKRFGILRATIHSSQGSITVQNIDDHIHATAKRLNLDIPTLDACMAGKAAKARIEEDQKDGNAIGVSSTPTLLVNGIKVVGLPQEKAFDKLVDQQLNPGRSASVARTDVAEVAATLLLSAIAIIE